MRKARIAFDLALDRHFVGEQEVLRHLLGDGRGAGRAALLAERAQVHHRRARDTDDVDAGVLIEILVLGRQERLHHALGDRAHRHEDALRRRIPAINRPSPA